MKSLVLLVFVSTCLCTSALHAAQQSRFAGGRLPTPKPRLLGTDGAMIPETGELGPFGDLDGDGDVDLVGDTGSYANNGAGIFRLARKVALPSEARIALFDADGDSRLDLLTRRHLLLGDGQGGFVDATADLLAGALASVQAIDAAALADVDGDGDLDLVCVRRYAYPVPATVALGLNDGSGAFTISPTLPSPPVSAVAVAAGDVDGDADLDLVVGSPLALWRNDGVGNFTSAAAGLSGPGEHAQLVDVDGDTDLDLLVASQNGFGPGNRQFLNDGSGVFSEVAFPQPAIGRLTTALLVLDREGDGDPDVVALASYEDESGFYFNARTSDRLLVNTGGVFADSGDLPEVLGSSRGGFAGDLDGDGDADLLVSGLTNRLYLNDGAGAFTPVRAADKVVQRTDGNGKVRRVTALADLDGNGLTDVFTPQRVYLNGVNGPPGVLTPLAGTLPPLPSECHDPTHPQLVSDVALGDVNGDGAPDAYVAVPLNECGCGGCQSNELWINDGTGHFADESATRLPHDNGHYEAAGVPLQVELLALDADGDLDAACVRGQDGDGSGVSTCYVNDGTGVFTRISELGYSARAGGFGDFDGDGDADYFEGGLAFVSFNGLHLNDGAAHFASSPGAVPSHPMLDIGVVVVGDIDGDGDLDAHLSPEAGYAHAAFVYVNDGTGHFVDQPGREPLPLASRGEFADLDLDGDQDLVTSSRLFLNDGTGNFALHTERADALGVVTFTGPAELALGDLDLDGDVDLIVAGMEATPVFNLTRHVRALGGPRIGQRFALEVHGPAWTPYVLRESLGTAQVSLGAQGYLLIDLAQLVLTTGGQLDQAGEALHRALIPNTLGLIGLTSYWQAFVGAPVHATNATKTTITGL